MRIPLRPLMLGTSLLALVACDDFDPDFRNFSGGPQASGAVVVESAPRPEPDDRGIISYPSYQVAVARRGDRVSDVAARVGIPVAELARYNGVPADATLNAGEILALPYRVSEPSPATGALGTGPIVPADQVDIQTLAGDAIDRSEGSIIPEVQTGAEPVRHKVEQGETAFSVARLYGVSVSALAEWNGLGSDRTIRTGQYLLIPVAAEDAPPVAARPVSRPGQGTATPVPPSASKPLPAEKPGTDSKPAATPPKEDLGSQATSASQSKAAMATPVGGKIIRDFRKGKNDGIDIAALVGTAVKAAEAGTVAAITQDTDQVPIVVLRHEGGLLTVYANVQSVKVSKGQKVSRGQTIGAVGKGDPAFVHFEVRKGLEAVDPNPYLN